LAGKAFVAAEPGDKKGALRTWRRKREDHAWR